MNKWDLYDDNLKKTNLIVDEKSEVPKGFYHLTSEVWILNDKKEVLLVRNALNYNRHYPGFWTCVGGSVLSGENPKEAIIRVIENRIGLEFPKTKITELERVKRDPYSYAYVTYLLYDNFNIDDMKFIDGFALEAKWVNLSELYNMIENGEVAWFLIQRIEKYVIPRLK